MIAIDIEATGLDPHKCSIVSLGAVDMKNPENQFYGECRVADDALIFDEAMAVNGFTREQIKDPSKPTVAEMLKEFIAWAEPIESVILAGHNVRFDINWMFAAFEKAGLDWPFGYRTFDSHTVAYTSHVQLRKPFPMYKGQPKLNLNNSLLYVGCPQEPDPHNALTGAQCCAEVSYRILYGKQLLDMFKTYPVPTYLVRE
jgi:DNA polymerase III epsilon subunit-like protein